MPSHKTRLPSLTTSAVPLPSFAAVRLRPALVFISALARLHIHDQKHKTQSLVRIPETLVIAMEFINLPTPSDQTPALSELMKATQRRFPDLKDKPFFWKRKASVLKCHMLLLTHLERLGQVRQ